MESVTIKDISQKAGVSPATVSRVLNNPSIVNPATREKVERIMNELHYVPSAVARNLSKSSSTIIGAIVADISNPFLSQLLKGVLTVCDREGYMLICMDNSDNMNSDFRALNAMREQRVAGLIYAPAVDYSYYSKTEKLKHFIDALCAPVVLVDRKVCWDEIPLMAYFSMIMRRSRKLSMLWHPAATEELHLLTAMRRTLCQITDFAHIWMESGKPDWRQTKS